MTNNVFTQTNDELVEKLEQLPNLYQTCFDLFYKKTNQERELAETKANLKKAESELLNFISETADETRISASELDHYVLNDEVIISIEWDDDQIKFIYKTSFSSNDSLKRIIKKLRPNPEPIEQPKEERTLDDILKEIEPLLKENRETRSGEKTQLLISLERELLTEAKRKTLYGNSVILKPKNLPFRKVVIKFDSQCIEYFHLTGTFLSYGVNQ